MEELQSTEILEREILEDARKKAARILKSAEDTMRAKDAQWENKTASAIGDLEAKYGEEKKLATEKLMARLPIDKLRSKVEKTESLLHEAMEGWYQKLGRWEILALLRKELSDRLEAGGFSASSAKKAYYHALELGEARDLLKFAGADIVPQEALSSNHYPSITLETDDARITASIQNIIDYYLLEKREELVEAMTDGAFTGDA